MIIYRAMSDLQDEGVSTDESDSKAEDGVVLTAEGHTEVARKIKENMNHSRSLSINSHHSVSSLQSDSSSDKSTPAGIGRSGIAVTFGITASDKLTASNNLGGWKITWLSKTYNKVVGLTGLTRRGDFRVSILCQFFVQMIDVLSRRISSTRSTFRCTSAMRPTRALALTV
jgi:hypothetical protein